MAHPFIPVPNVARLDVGHTLNGHYFQNTVYFEALGHDYDSFELLTLAEEFGNWYILNVLPVLSRYVALIRITAKAMHSDAVPDVILSYSSIVGGFNNRALPSSCGLCIQLSSRRKVYQPYFHLYCTGIPDTVVFGNQIDAGWAESLRFAWSTLLDLPHAIPTVWCSVSFIKDKQYRPFGVTYAVGNPVIESLTISPRPQRLRKPIL